MMDTCVEVKQYNICPSGLFCIRTNFLPSLTNTIISNWNKSLNGISRGQNVYWSACTKPKKWAVMYLCVMGIKFAPFNDFSIFRLEFGMFRQCGISVFRFLTGSIPLYMCGRSIDFCWILKLFYCIFCFSLCLKEI